MEISFRVPDMNSFNQLGLVVCLGFSVVLFGFVVVCLGFVVVEELYSFFLGPRHSLRLNK